ncbi:hypothetical protein [Prevotella sp. kh1p2]|uniref:hypothetical protein n=1 Tax=Prevotella sp. kh1p2 TaxID=1761883 RepID=UPI0008B8B83D|nr:hypothetical protein [Prevotella sp. kh1p2]SES89213.1 hypothetical protein SAMN04487825_10755 [Prevotella sp. kh1p2]
MASLWKWRADDLDTIFKVINQGLMKKPYWVEYHDVYDDGTPVWNGEKSVFWNMLEQAYPEEWRQMMRRMMSKMEELGGLQKGTHQEKLMAFFDKYYFQVIGDFSSMLYNEDGKNYEQMKLAMLQGRYANDTDPLGQSLGNASSPERAWVKKRIQYMMSKYSFGDYDATTADGSITVRTSAQADGSSNSIVLRLTPALKLYPTIGYGTTAIRGARTDAGKPCEITVDINGTSDQQLSIKSADWLLDIGDWSGYVINGALSVIGKRLKRLKLGDADASKVKILISSLTLGNTVSLTEIDVQNIATLGGSLDLRNNYRLRSFLGKGTKLTEAHFADGGALEKVEYPETASYIELKNLDNLTNDNCDIRDCKGNVMSYFVAGCDQLQPIKKLTEILDAQQGQPNHALRYVRCVGFNETFSDGTMFDKLVRLVDGTYQGIDAEGQYGNDQYPVLDGTINLTTGAYRDSYDALMVHYPKLKLNIAKWWIRFEDPEVKRICVENWDKDGDGELSTEEAATVSSIGTNYWNNIKAPSEPTWLFYFKNVRIMPSSWNKNLMPLYLGPGVSRFSGDYAFRFQDSIDHLVLPAVYKGGWRDFEYTPNTRYLVILNPTPWNLYGLGNCMEGPSCIFVKDESYDLYITEETWKNKKDRIHKLSEFSKLFPRDDISKEIAFSTGLLSF